MAHVGYLYTLMHTQYYYTQYYVHNVNAWMDELNYP